MVIKRTLRSFLAVSALALLGSAYGAGNAPDAAVRSATEDVLAVIAKTPDPRTLRETAETKVVPHFDFRRMTQLAAGRVWAQASAQQQDALTSEFQHLLVRTYTKALSSGSHANAAVTVQPARVDDGSSEATVRTTVTEPGRKPVAINYRMEKAGADWKVVDVVVENISLVTNYRDWFASQAQSGGVDGVIRALADKNKAATAAAG